MRILLSAVFCIPALRAGYRWKLITNITIGYIAKKRRGIGRLLRRARALCAYVNRFLDISPICPPVCMLKTLLEMSKTLGAFIFSRCEMRGENEYENESSPYPLTYVKSSISPAYFRPRRHIMGQGIILPFPPIRPWLSLPPDRRPDEGRESGIYAEGLP